MRFADFVLDIVGGNVEDVRKQMCNHPRIRHVRRIGEDGIHREADGKLPALAVVNRSALGADFENALLLVLGFREVVAVTEKLEVTQAGQTTAIQTTASTQTISQRRRGLRCSMDSGLPHPRFYPAASR